MIKTEVKEKGNWNFRYKDKQGIYTKPLVEITTETLTRVWAHNEILQLITAYHEVDKKAMQMIADPNTDTGEIKFAETSFLAKLKQHIKELEK